MSTHQPFTISQTRVVSRGRTLAATHVRLEHGRIAALGDVTIQRPGDAVIDGRGSTLLPGLVDAHVHLLPGCTQLAAAFGVTTVLDMFSKPDVIDPERAAVAASARGQGPVRADVRTSSIGATAPGGHPTLAYSPLPYVTGPGEAASFVDARLAEGADHLKVIYDDGSGAMLDLPSLDVRTIEALVAAAHRHGLPVVAHVSTAVGAVTVARCGVDVLAHAPFDRMSDVQVRDVALAGVAVIATLAIVDGFPGLDGVMPLLGQTQLAQRLSPRWRRVLERQAKRWMPPEPPDGTAQRGNVQALQTAGVRILAGTDAPNPGLVHGASLHRELQHLVQAGLTPAAALSAATSVPAQVFGLTDRGVIEVNARADLLLVTGDPTTDIAATQSVSAVWVAGRRVEDDIYAGSATEREGLAWQKASTAKIMTAIVEAWPGIPAPHDVTREDGELLGQVVPTGSGWQATTVFGASLGHPTTHDEAVGILEERGLSSLAEPWWVRVVGDSDWQQAQLLELERERVRLRWPDPMTDQPPSGRWLELDEIDLVTSPPEDRAERSGGIRGPL